ncbi:Methylthioribulose-1-phosphate dehydratase [Wickerhamiella sorbophila]|uniref:Methylthioribulose-1-phosphate dehydratase n=1 Tax=Wickerhamiella sorbophila TaxID=45607 RepID=A0A2T0FH73_9ASCO|nr:Methylthioribulose-1-phosphate dehydratase [Wickerhamiella sorbophila]PRT54334.1 Methylthioribulose-1-phosphate dehydratase [Wickerhamiella sorbophila]
MGSDTNAQYVPEETDPAKIIVELCKLFYAQGWVTGTAGGMSIKDGDLVYVAPSGVQKERMNPVDLFVYDTKSKTYVSKPELYKPSACTPLFMACYEQRRAGACIHTHSQNAVMASLLWGREFRIANIEQVKAIPKVVEPGNLSFFDTLVIPIIENTAHEEDLAPDLEKALLEYPMAPAVLVRRHGLYVWGANVWKAKIINEAIDYLLELAVKMRHAGIDPAGDIGSEQLTRKI